jgi:hypothetical protein
MMIVKIICKIVAVSAIIGFGIGGIVIMRDKLVEFVVA